MYTDKKEIRQALMDMIVSECNVQPATYVDDGTWDPRGEGFDNFITTDGRRFPWIEHIYEAIDSNSVVAVFAIESECKMPSDRLKKLWSFQNREVLLNMGCYHVTRVTYDDTHGVWWTLIVATVNEIFDKYLFVINN